jgi:hypothetical protein
MRHGGITGFEVKIGRDGGIYEPGTGPSTNFSIKGLRSKRRSSPMYFPR